MNKIHRLKTFKSKKTTIYQITLIFFLKALIFIFIFQIAFKILKNQTKRYLTFIRSAYYLFSLSFFFLL
jgi:hypothetical protein